MTEFLLRHGWSLLASVAVKSLFVPSLAALIVLFLRRSSAAARHLVWRLALCGLLLLPLFSWMPAAWQVPLAPRALLVPTDAPVITPGPVMPDSGNVGAQHAAPLPPAASPTLRPLPPPELGAGGHSFPWPVWACVVWLAGCVLTLLPTLIGLAGVGRLARRSVPLTDGPLPDLTATLAQELGIKTPVRLLTGEAGTPMTWGWLRPVILLPPDAAQWPEDRLRAVLLHELSHIARADWPAQMASHLACACYWFNPLVWLAARQARLEGERACDDRVLLAGVPAPDYARHLLDVARSLRDPRLPTALPLVNAATLKVRLQIILDSARKRGEVGKWLKVVLLEAITIPVFLFSYLVVFAVPMPPNRAVRLDVQSYQVIGQANAATSALRSLQAHIHATMSFSYPNPPYTMDGTAVFQRPNLARVEVPGPSGFTFASDGSHSRLSDHDGTHSYILPVNWNGDNMTADDESQPFVQYFFLPDFHRLGAYLTDDTVLPFQVRAIPVVGRYLGVQTWQGAQYQVVEFTRNVIPRVPSFKNTTTVYVGADHLVHRIVGRAYFSQGIRTDDVWLTDLQTNQVSSPSAFRQPVQGQANP